MTMLAAAALFFVGIHVLISGTRMRDALVARLGERPYLGLFSLLSALGLAWLIWAFLAAQAGPDEVSPLARHRAVAGVLNLLAFIFIVYGVTGRSPTSVGREHLLARDDAARGMERITRHSMLWGFALWAGTHMVFNPEPPTLVFFGAFLVLALVGPPSIDAKRARRHGANWQRYLARTSNVPFVAIVQGRNRLALGELELWKLAVALAAYAAFVALHARFFGLPAL